MSAADKNPSRPVRSSYAPSSQRSRTSEVPKKTRSSIANPSSSFQKPKQQSTNKRQSDANTEESHISVYVRCRSRNDREIKENSGVVVSTMGHMGKEVCLQTGPMSVSNKTYTFDRVFGAESDQEMVYDGIANSVLDEMLQGYNCTVFAYGQTGTGKTYTMSGDIEMSGNQLSENAGIIPRTLVALFKQLEKSPDFSVKISFIELYNEELRDLLVQNETGERKVRIFEEPSKKSIVVQGMEEIFIKSATEGMKVLSDGSYKRQVAATQCNDLSSRSHTVFTITVHMKEIDPISGEEYLKIGKLNLVDLAGSENINRSGAENKRAREAGMINQSLLTLGRVINALVDQSPHIPYRESKLTRLLQDSLGGQTKTCIIATISPAKVSLEETLSTLEYANRAKSIKNKPQVNSSMSKKMLIREYVQEIERLRNDLNATRSKNGIYVTEENWQQVTAESESRRIQVDEQKLRMEVLEEQIKKFKTNFETQLAQLNKVEHELVDSKQQNEQLSGKLNETCENLNKTQQQLRLEEFVSEEYKNTEIQLLNIGTSLNKLLDDVVKSKDALHDIINKKANLEAENMNILDLSKKEIVTRTNDMSLGIQQFQQNSSHLSNVLNENFTNMVNSQKSKIGNKCEGVSQISNYFVSAVDKVMEKLLSKSEVTKTEIGNIENVKSQIKSQIIDELNELKNDGVIASHTMETALGDLEKTIDENFDLLNQQVQSTLETVKTQLQTQTNEIIELKTKLVEHQFKYIDLIKHQAMKFESFREAEKQKSKFEKQQLLEQITSLIDNYDNNRNERMNTEVDSLKPELENIAMKQNDFTHKFEKFISETWVSTQTQFQQQLNEQGSEFLSKTNDFKSTISDQVISNISSNIAKTQELQSQKFDNSISNLDQGLVKLTTFAESLKHLNDENSTYTKQKLDKVKSTVAKSFDDISQSFKEFGEELQESKPQLVDDFLQKQSNFLSDFKNSSIQSINALNDYVSSVSYAKDDENPPKRQKLETHKELPKSKTRQEIELLHHDEIFGQVSDKNDVDESEHLSVESSYNKDQSASPLMPVPDRPFKQPLATSKRDLNIIRTNSSEKLKQAVNNSGKSRSRPSSSLSQRSV